MCTLDEDIAELEEYFAPPPQRNTECPGYFEFPIHINWSIPVDALTLASRLEAYLETRSLFPVLEASNKEGKTPRFLPPEIMAMVRSELYENSFQSKLAEWKIANRCFNGTCGEFNYRSEHMGVLRSCIGLQDVIVDEGENFESLANHASTIAEFTGRIAKLREHEEILFSEVKLKPTFITYNLQACHLEHGVLILFAFLSIPALKDENWSSSVNCTRDCIRQGSIHDFRPDISNHQYDIIRSLQYNPQHEAAFAHGTKFLRMPIHRTNNRPTHVLFGQEYIENDRPWQHVREGKAFCDPDTCSGYRDVSGGVPQLCKVAREEVRSAGTVTHGAHVWVLVVEGGYPNYDWQALLEADRKAERKKQKTTTGGEGKVGDEGGEQV